MLNVTELRIRAKRVKLVVKATTPAWIVAHQLALTISQREKQELPPCFGILYQKKTKCERCLVKTYCEVVQDKALWRDANLASEVSEYDLDAAMPLGFKEGSRPHLLIRKWTMMLTIEELQNLSQKLFRSIIDIPRMLKQLQSRRLLVTKGGRRFGVKTRLRRY